MSLCRHNWPRIRDKLLPTSELDRAFFAPVPREMSGEASKGQKLGTRRETSYLSNKN